MFDGQRNAWVYSKGRIAGLAAWGAAVAVVGEDTGEAGGEFLGGGWVGPSAFGGAGELL